jgi:CheY-like chemotaxis protein
MRELLDRTLGDDIVLEVAFPEELPPLACDSGQLESALVNLAVNARDAMAGHGRLSMRCRVCSPDDSSVQVKLDPARGAYIEITVADDGPGMSEETRKRAFEPFFTTKPEGRGTGLGLSMVFGFVTQYGGAVDIRSMPGAGTSVLLYLPCDEAVLETAPLKDTKPAPNLRGFRILVVEDNETIRHSVAARLRQLGCDVHEAASGDEALSILAGSSSWDLLLSDIDLPTMDGYELCLKARKQFPQLRVILMTGYADSKWLDVDELDGATEALIKPFDMGDLLAKAQLLLRSAD